MPVSGRSTWLCGDRACRCKLATVRGVYPERRVRFLTVVVYREDGVIEIVCPACQRLNRFRWTKPVAPLTEPPSLLDSAPTGE